MHMVARCARGHQEVFAIEGMSDEELRHYVALANLATSGFSAPGCGRCPYDDRVAISVHAVEGDAVDPEFLIRQEGSVSTIERVRRGSEHGHVIGAKSTPPPKG